jgi:hypothetical protein
MADRVTDQLDENTGRFSRTTGSNVFHGFLEGVFEILLVDGKRFQAIGAGRPHGPGRSGVGSKRHHADLFVILLGRVGGFACRFVFSSTGETACPAYMISSSSRTEIFAGPPSLRFRSSARITASARSRIERRNLLLSFRNRR